LTSAAFLSSRKPARDKTEQPVAIELDFMQPVLAFRRRVDQRGKLNARVLLLQLGERLLRCGGIFGGFGVLFCFAGLVRLGSFATRSGFLAGGDGVD
jgi:hypothetical protein